MGLIKMNGVNYWGSAYGQGIIAPMIYSEEEIEVGVWRDGKPLYQRVFDLGSDVLISPNNFTNTSIDASQMQTLVDAWGIYSTGVTKYSLMANISNNIIRLQTDRNGASANVRYVVLQYTKTTDTAGSGIWNGQGGLAHHYSTNETIVGTWIDGKPIYEITKTGLSLTIPYNSWVNSGIDATTIDTIINAVAYDNNGTCFNTIMANTAGAGTVHTTFGFQTGRNGSSISATKIVLQYTKTTDV